MSSPYLLLQSLHQGCNVGVTVFLDLLHLHVEFLLGHPAEVAVLLHGPQQDVPLVLPLLSQGSQNFTLQ